MHSSIETSPIQSFDPAAYASLEASTPATINSYNEYRIIRRNGAVVGFEPSKIAIAVTKAFLAVNGGQGAASARIRELVEQLTSTVVNALMRRQPAAAGSARARTRRPRAPWHRH